MLENGPAEIFRSSAQGSRFVVVDLEATCWEGKHPDRNEIIEIGAVCYSVGEGVVAAFQTFVKPKLQPVLSEFCTQLTHITQDEVNDAPAFPDAFQRFHDWCTQMQPLAFASWGQYDLNQFKSDCRLHDIPLWIENHVNLKVLFSEITGRGKSGMKRALYHYEIPLEGTHHRGIDDARNIARILGYMIADLIGEPRAQA